RCSRVMRETFVKSVTEYLEEDVAKICFFQAEDGIRDRNVTGVQTCALPICPRSIRSPWNRTRVPNCSMTASGEWLGSMIPPEPTRIRSVSEAARSISSAVALEARLFVLWCSANQSRSYRRDRKSVV